jgi:APA family basic amino acid/polyamine antiporter
MERPFKTPSVPVLPIVSAVSCIALMASLAVETWLRFLAWLVVGLVIYFVYGRTHSRLAPGREEAIAAQLDDETVV